MLSRWPMGTERPRGLVIYKNDENITQSWVENPEIIADPDAVYHIYTLPKGGVVGAITNIISTILNPILKLFMPNTAGSASLKNSRSASSNNALQGRTNASRPGERIADIRGFVRAYPDLLMDYRMFKDRTEYEVQFLCVGVGEYQLDDIRDGITPASNINGELLNFYKSGNAPGYGSSYLNVGGLIDVNQFPVMLAKASNEADGSEVKPPNYSDISKVNFFVYSTGEIDTAVSDDPSIVIDWSERAPIGTMLNISGFYSFTPNPGIANTYTRNDLTGTYPVLSSGENIILLNTSGHPGWSSFSATGQTAYKQAYLRSDGFWQFTSGSGATLQTFTPRVESASPYVVGPYLLESADRIMINLYAQNGIYKTDGEVYPFTCEFQVILIDPNGIQPNVSHQMFVTGRYTEAVLYIPF